MHVLLVYDIAHDGTRAKVADICEDYGLERVQYSAFWGDLGRVYQEEMFSKMRDRLGQRSGKIHLFPMCRRDWEARLEVHQEGKDDANVASQ